MLALCKQAGSQQRRAAAALTSRIWFSVTLINFNQVTPVVNWVPPCIPRGSMCSREGHIACNVIGKNVSLRKDHSTPLHCNIYRSSTFPDCPRGGDPHCNLWYEPFPARTISCFPHFQRITYVKYIIITKPLKSTESRNDFFLYHPCVMRGLAG